MKQHPAAEKYEDMLDKVERLHKQIQSMHKEFTEIQNELYMLNKIHKDYVKEVIEAFNKEDEVEPTIKRYKKVLKKLGITTKEEDFEFLQTDILGILSYYVPDGEVEKYEDE